MAKPPAVMAGLDPMLSGLFDLLDTHLSPRKAHLRLSGVSTNTWIRFRARSRIGREGRPSGMTMLKDHGNHTLEGGNPFNIEYIPYIVMGSRLRGDD